MTLTTRELAREVASAREWMIRCGGTVVGYVAKYGSASDPEHYGDGGEAIYAADKAALDKMEARLAMASAAEAGLSARRENSPFAKIIRAREMLESVDFPEGGEDWSLLANATTALDMILERRPK